MKKIGEFVYNFINDGGWITCLVLAFFGVLFSVIAIYGKLGFNLTRFLLADLPLFGFCGWALYKGVYCMIRDHKDIFGL